MRTNLFGGLSVLLACVVLAPSALGQETRRARRNQEKPQEPATPAASAEEAEAPEEAGSSEGAAGMDAAAMQRWMEAATPGENHQFLERLVGTWKTTMRMWPAGPESEPTETTGTVTSRLILGGRYLEEQMQGEVNGMPFHGSGLTGYDNFKRKYVGIWVDDMSTSMIVMQGTRDASGQTLTMYGLMDEPMTGEQDKMAKFVTQVVNENKHIFQIYDLSAGEDHKALEVIYERQE